MINNPKTHDSTREHTEQPTPEAIRWEHEHLFDDPKLREGVCDVLNTVFERPPRD